MLDPYLTEDFPDQQTIRLSFTVGGFMDGRILHCQDEIFSIWIPTATVNLPIFVAKRNPEQFIFF